MKMFHRKVVYLVYRQIRSDAHLQTNFVENWPLMNRGKKKHPRNAKASRVLYIKELESLQSAFQFSRQYLLRSRADLLIHDLAVFEHQQGWDVANAELLSYASVCIYI